MGINKDTASETQHTLPRGTSGCDSEIQTAIGRWLAAQYEVPWDVPERLASLLEQLAEPTGNR
jgi:hypothetical protein